MSDAQLPTFLESRVKQMCTIIREYKRFVKKFLVKGATDLVERNKVFNEKFETLEQQPSIDKIAEYGN